MLAHEIRISVRWLVEFSIHGADIIPSSMADMMEGARAHKARQSSSQAEAEKALQWTGTAAGMLCTVTGHIDMYDPLHTPPIIEEIKLLPSHAPIPETPNPAHRAQAACYAHMLCVSACMDAVTLRVSYVTNRGEIRAKFDEFITRDQAEEIFLSLLAPLAEYESSLADFREIRNESLKTMMFPYQDYRPGQREMAIQVYTAITQKKRLFATMPTGTGKSAAALFPALKALCEGKTERIFYLTARTTARQSAADALALMRKNGMRARTLMLTAKEKQCPQDIMRCHPDHCLRAKGHFIRLGDGLREIMKTDDWSADNVRKTADTHLLCPFEFALSLCETADVIICDYNYVFDPMVQIKRIFERKNAITLLVDESHNLPSRVRDMLSGVLSSAEISEMRRSSGKLNGRSGALYRSSTTLIHAVRNVSGDAQSLPDSVIESAENLLDAMCTAFDKPQPEGFSDMFRMLLSFLYAARCSREAVKDYVMLVKSDGKERGIRLLCLNITAHLEASTKRMNGSIFFSATLSPLPNMKQLLGGSEEDACFEMPSPFPADHLLVLRCAVNARFRFRERTALEAAQAILAVFHARPGNYIAFFPSYAYLSTVREALISLETDLPLHVQERGMTEESRDRYLERFRETASALLGLCVLGGVFAEGIDLPGLALIGVAIIGVGLPQVNREQEALREHYQVSFNDGFAYAYRYPGMHKVLQAAGRVIRSETDLGVVLLLDDRYNDPEYASLLPPHYKVVPVNGDKEIALRAQEFWNMYGNTH